METEQRVVVVDVNMKFGSMVAFLVKLAIPFIPAALILLLFFGATALVLKGIFS